MFNKVILVGNLTRDVELRYLPSGSAVCNTAIATNRRFKSQSGEQKEEVCFIDISLFGRTAEVANQYLKKGSKVLVEGRLKLDQWTDQSGQKRSRHTVSVENLQMLDSKSQSQDNNFGNNYQQNDYAPQDNTYSNNNYQNNNSSQSSRQNANSSNNIPEIDIDDDEIPF